MCKFQRDVDEALDKQLDMYLKSIEDNEDEGF